MRKLIYITIESKSRELYPKLFLINSALKKNFDCFIGDKVSIARAVKILGKGIYFYKSMNHYDTDHIKEVKKNNLYVVQVKFFSFELYAKLKKEFFHDHVFQHRYDFHSK